MQNTSCSCKRISFCQKCLSHNLLKLKSDTCFPEPFPLIYETASVNQDEAFNLLKMIAISITSFNGDQEQFYKTYRKVTKDCEDFDVKFGKNQARLFLHELSNVILSKLLSVSESESFLDTGNDFNLSEKEMAGLQYLSGYVFHKLFSKLRKSKRYYESFEVKLSCDLLKAAKIDDEAGKEKRRLINIKDRGGLWTICEDGEQMFVELEKSFRKVTSGFKTKVDKDQLLIEAVNNTKILFHFQKLIERTEIHTEELATSDKFCVKKLLTKLLQLYIHVRMHSHAKDIKERMKVKNQQSRKKSLRCELKRLEDSNSSQSSTV